MYINEEQWNQYKIDVKQDDVEKKVLSKEQYMFIRRYIPFFTELHG